jgi:hypothetical protein
MVAFDRGEIGIVRPHFRRTTLAMAYRVLSGQPQLQVDYTSSASYPEETQPKWLAIRDKVFPPDGAAPAAERKRRLNDYSTPINCLGDAYATAVKTFGDREQRYGADSAALKDWVRAQSAVFANCDEEPLLLPEPAAADADALTKADRAYQTAAAYFYAMQFDEAARRFREIAADTASPWRPYGRFLAARSVLRTATMGTERAADHPEALAAAEKEFQAVIADPIAAPVHDSARGLLRFVGLRLHPLDELRTTAAQVASTRDELPFTELENFNYLLGHQSPPGAEYDQQMRTWEAARGAHDLVDWLDGMRGLLPTERDHAMARWRRTQSMPWLVAALTQLHGPHESADALLAAAGAVPAASPAFPSVSFLRVRVLIELGRIDEARRVLASLPDVAGPGVLQETINLYRGERFMIASTFEELVKAAPRLSVPASLDDGKTFAPIDSFDEDAAAGLGERLPLERLIDAGVSATLPERLQKRVAIAAFTRAILLDRHDSARRIAPVLRTLAPPLATDLDRYMRETTLEGRRHAAILLIVRTPGMTKDVRGLDDEYSIEFVEPRRAFANFILPWWCEKPATTVERVAGEVKSQLVHMLYPKNVVPYPSFVTADERTAVEREFAALAATGPASRYLATGALEWARTRPRDPEAAEALSRVVNGWRRACRDEADVELSRRSFQVLHKQFPGSEWAERTKYWYR